MKFSTTAIVLAAAIGTSAHPSGHAHHHVHRSVEARDNFVMAKKPSPPPPPPPAAAIKNKVEADKPAKVKTPAASTPSASKPSSKGTAKSFCGGKSKRATLAEIAYAGNTGADGDYGCNLMVVDNSVADQYDYTTTFTNAAGSDQACSCWLKIGRDGGINGFFKNNQALDFTLPSGGKVVVAAEGNTQGGCACGSGSIPTTSWGQFASSWVEFDFGNESNNKWSGADASCLVASANGLKIPGLNVCSKGKCSTINPGGSGTNAYLKGMEALDGVGLNLAAGPAHLEVTVGYQG